MKKVLCLVLALVLAVSMFAFAGCDNGEKDDGQVVIGWSVYNAAYEFFLEMQNGVVEKGAELGYKVLTHDQKESEDDMITACQNYIAQKVDALVISPCKPEAMSTIVNLAKAQNIPVIIVDIGDGGSNKDAIVISDVFGGGQIAAKYAMDLIKESNMKSKNYAIIKCETSAVYAIRRGQGFQDIMDKNGFTKVMELTANSDQTQGYDAMQDILTKHKDDLSVVFCENDNMALGAAEAIDAAGLKGKILVIGFNADAAAVTATKDGLMQGTIAQDPYGMGVRGIELAKILIDGGTITYDDPATKEIYADVWLVDKDGNKNTNYKAG